MSDDLVQRLRHESHIVHPENYELIDEAADRIEALEQTMWQMHNEAHEHIKRIEALEKRWDLQVDDAVRMAAERISQLEAALREIRDGNDRSEDTPNIARRALENKP